MTDLALAIPLRVELRRADVLHFLGYRGQGIPAARIERALGAAIEEARSLVAPRGAHRTLPAEEVGGLGLEALPGDCLALGLVTIGPALETQVTALLARGEMTRALLLDAAGSAAAEEAADELEGIIRAGHYAPGSGRAAGGARRFSPGYGRWPLTAQTKLFERLPHEALEIRLLPSCLMTPRKSVSFALWLGEDDPAAPRDCRARRCADCDMDRCLYRESGDPA